jgi:hypothetical protein
MLSYIYTEYDIKKCPFVGMSWGGSFIRDSSNTPHKFHVSLCVLNIKIWSHQTLSTYIHSPRVEWQNGSVVWGRGFTAQWGETSGGALCIMRNSFVLCNIVSYQTSSIWTLQWQVYTLFSSMTFKTFIFWIIFILLMLRVFYFILLFLTQRLHRKHYRMTYVRKETVTNKPNGVDVGYRVKSEL